MEDHMLTPTQKQVINMFLAFKDLLCLNCLHD